MLGLSCNQFAGQEPGSEAEILGFCLREYDISFPLFSEIEVNGSNTHPNDRRLKGGASGLPEGDAIEWNFAKFLVGRDGQVVNRYASKFSPGAIEPDTVRAMAAPPPPIARPSA